MRNGYRAAWRTYRRPLFLVLLIPAATWIVMFGVTILISHELHRMDMPDFSRPVPKPIQAERAPTVAEVQHTVITGQIGLASLILLIFVGVDLSIHLKEMLGSPISSLVPGLQRAHLTLAALIVALLIGALALAICCGPDLGISSLAVVACLLVMLAIPAFLAHWLPAALLVMVVVLSLLMAAQNGRPLAWPPSAPVCLIILAVSIGCLVSVGMRLRRFNEEMFEYRRRIPIVPATSTARVPWSPFPVGDVRYWRRIGALSQANLLWRARHWHAAWGTIWMVPIMGIFLGGLTGTVAFVLRQFSVLELIASPNLPYLAVMPVLGVLGPNRPYLMQELLRPQTRGEHVRAVGATLATATFLCWSSMLAAVVVMSWIANHDGLPIEHFWRPAAFSLCCLLTFFGIATWPYRTAAVHFCYFAMFGVMSSFALTPMRLSDRDLVIAASALALAGAFLTRRSYLRWVNDEVDWNSTAWSSTWFRGRRSRSAGAGSLP